jgi:DNA primase
LIPQSFIQELLARVDVVDVVGQHVKLRKAGANLLGLCPFHSEKSPSFTVSPTKQFYHCFGCGVHGSAIGFLMEHAGLSYVEAIRDLADSVGMTVPDEGPGAAREAARAPGLLDLLAKAERFYRERLKDSPRAIDYLKGRGLSGRTAAHYGVGFAPEGWRSLQAAMPDYSAPELLEAGLVIESQNQNSQGSAGGESEPTVAPAAMPARRYDRFRDRIMFPIRNPRGQVIGFGGRIIDAGEPKYMNSPETPVFSKGRELYGMFEAREALRQTNCAIVVEGYMDVVMLAQHGVGNAVATLGTSTTPDHVRKLLRTVDRIVFAFDGDAAGRKAAWRALQACLPEAADTKRLEFLFLPAEHDPDSYVREHGPQGFEALLAEALPLSEFLVQELSEQVDLQESEGRARLLALARPLLQQLPEAALRLQLVHRVADIAGIETAEMHVFLSASNQRDSAGGRRDARFDGRHSPTERVDWGRSGTGDGAGYAGSNRRGDASGDWSHHGAVAGGRSAPWNGAGKSARGRGRGADFDGGWQRGGASRSGSDARWDDALPMSLRARKDPPALSRRVRLLSALHPALAADELDPQFLPAEVREWLDLLRELPAGSSFAGLCEALRSAQPETVTTLERDAAADRSMVADMTFEEARAEFDGALAQLRDRNIRTELDEIVARGLTTNEDRERYQQLIALRGRA